MPPFYNAPLFYSLWEEPYIQVVLSEKKVESLRDLFLAKT